MSAPDADHAKGAHLGGGAGRVGTTLRAGMVAINNWGPSPGAPFGGYKQSGNGRGGGLYGLRDFMEVKSISGLPA